MPSVTALDKMDQDITDTAVRQWHTSSRVFKWKADTLKNVLDAYNTIV